MRNFAKYLCLILILCTLIATVFAIPVSAANPAFTGLSGSGQRLDPYRISSVSDLIKFRKLVHSGKTFEGQYVLQTCDLDLGSLGGTWLPIGDWESESFFYGTYNGGGHVIKNLVIYGGNSGFFSCLGGSVLNLGIESGSIEGGCVGSIASHSTASAMIINCYNKASITGFRVGGIADNFSGGEIIDCWNVGTLTTNAAESGGTVAGIVGYDAECVIYSHSDGIGALAQSFGGYSEFVSEKALTDADIARLEARFKEASDPYLTPLSLLANSSFEGNGTKQSPYLIKSTDDFIRFRALTNVGCSFFGQYVRQEADIDLGAYESFTPIAERVDFCGVYDGAGHTISNLFINGAEGESVALFGGLGGTILNLGIESGRIAGDDAAGIVARGEAGVPMVINCYNKASVEGKHSAGGIVGNFSAGLVVNSLFAGDISSEGLIGGICAQSVKRAISSFSIGSSLAPRSAGIIEDSCRKVSNLNKAVKLLNASLYESATVTNFQNNDLSKWNADATFGKIHVYTVRFILQEVLIALVFFSLLTLLVLVWKSARREGKLSVRAMGATVGSFREKWRSDAQWRMHAIVCAILVFGFGMLAVGYINRDSSITNALGYWPDTGDVFMDYLNPLSTVTNNNYAQTGHYTDVGGTYPPIARAIFWITGQILPADSYFATAQDIRTSHGITLTFMIFAVSICVLWAAYKKMNRGDMPILNLLILFCSPMIFLIDRGNLLIITYLATVGFIMGYRSENTLVRHLSYVCLGIAAATKIYPVVLGLLVLKERNRKNTLWCIFYGVLFCIVPFFFIGGIWEIILYVRNVTSSVGKNAVSVNGWLINYGNTLAGLFKAFFGNAALGKTLAGVTVYPIMALLLACVFLCREHWKSVLALTLIIVLYPGYSVAYCAIFYVIPLLLLLSAKPQRKLDTVFAVLLALTLTPMQFLCGAIGLDPSYMWMTVGALGIALAILLIIDCARDTVKRITEHRRTAQSNTPSKA